MSWPPERSSPAPVIRPDTGRSVWKIRVQQNSRTGRQAQDHRLDARDRFARAAVFEEFDHRAAMAVYFDAFRDRRPGDPPRPSPELRRVIQGWPS